MKIIQTLRSIYNVTLPMALDITNKILSNRTTLRMLGDDMSLEALEQTITRFNNVLQPILQHKQTEFNAQAEKQAKIRKIHLLLKGSDISLQELLDYCSEVARQKKPK